MNIETQALLGQLPERRWFGSKARPIERLELCDACIVEDGPPALVLALVEVRFADGGAQLYHMPLLVEEDGRARDAAEEPQRLGLFGDLMAHHVSIKGNAGVFEFAGPGLDPLSPPGNTVRVIAGEQSNTSAVLDETVILKLFRRVAVGPNPDLELGRLLTAQGYEHLPPHVGDISYRSENEDGEVEIDLGVAQQYFADAVDGWAEILRHLHFLYDSAHPEDAKEDLRFLTDERSMLLAIEELGDATAALHVVLARLDTDPDLAAEPADASDVNRWADAVHAALQRELRESPEIEPLAVELERQIERLRSVEDAGWKTRVHGDYHLGQVLLAQRGWLILDFEGEPARPLEARRAKQSPLRDVAGMLRSFSYAALAALFERAEPESDEWRRLEPWADTWETLARERFIAAYLRRSHEGHFLPGDRDDLAAMLDAFEIDKALYELGYERGHRPEWRRIPLRGLAKVVERARR